MNEHLDLHSWVRAQNSISLARIAEVQTQQDVPGQEKVRLRLRIEEMLWRDAGEAIQAFEFVRPQSEVSRLKFPDPAWGRVTIQKGVTVFLVTEPSPPAEGSPIYAEEVRRADDPVLGAVRAVLQAEKARTGVDERVRRYVQWVQNGPTVARLFGAKALAQDADLNEARTRLEVVNSLIGAFAAGQDRYVRIGAGTWLWEDVYPKSSGAARVAILNAMIQGISDKSEPIRSFSIDNLMTIDPAALRQPGVAKSPGAIHFLQPMLAEETDSEARAKIQALMDGLK